MLGRLPGLSLHEAGLPGRRHVVTTQTVERAQMPRRQFLELGALHALRAMSRKSGRAQPFGGGQPFDGRDGFEAESAAFAASVTGKSEVAGAHFSQAVIVALGCHTGPWTSSKLGLKETPAAVRC